MMSQPFHVTADPAAPTRQPGRPSLTASSTCSNCERCCVATLCLPGGLGEDDLRPLASMSLTTRRFGAGESIYMEGAAFRHLYAIRTGTCKTAIVRGDGREHVTGFHLAGDFMGLEGLAEGVHRTTATALEDTQVCLIPYNRLLAVTASHPGANDLITHVMAREITHHSSLLVLLGLTAAPQRVAAFLLNLSERYAARGWSPREFHLRMGRADIASFLGLKLETISRTLTMFERSGYIERRGRTIRITDLAGLRGAYELRIH